MSNHPQTLCTAAVAPKETQPAPLPDHSHTPKTREGHTRMQTQDTRTQVEVRTIHVDGLPAPQGSKTAFALKKDGKYTGATAMTESSAKVKPWRAAVVAAARGGATIPGPVAVAITFYLPRPKGHYGTGRNAGKLKPAAPALPGVKPDVDKLVRSTLDGLTTAGVYEDDSRVTDLLVAKRYADGRGQGATVEVSAAA